MPRKRAVFLTSLSFDIIVLDVMMPGENGFDFAASLRRTSQVPILMLTARSRSDDRVRGLEIGVDDYLAKPHEPKELLLRDRLDSAAARARGGSKVRRCDRSLRALRLSLERGELRQRDEVVRITEREREMLRLLCAHSGESVSREALTGSAGAANERTIDVQINRLRPENRARSSQSGIYLQTARGAGYRLVADG